jgi:hypothetical protein
MKSVSLYVRPSDKKQLYYGEESQLFFAHIDVTTESVKGTKV